MIRVCLIGLGKTGSEVAKVLLAQEDIKLAAAVCRPGSSKEGRDLGEVIGCRDTGIIVAGADKLKEVIFRYKPDIALDFSKPEATIRNAVTLSRMKVNMVIATTGFSRFSLKRLFVLTRKYHNGIVYAPNITLGVNVLMLLTGIASSILNNYDFQINEAHHNKKKDIPSGTALKIAGEIEKALTSSAGNGAEAEEASLRRVPINAVRAGGIVGRHEVVIAGEEDMIEISHQSFSRKAFAMGAIRAVKYIYKKTGYFEMSDVLNLGSILSNYLENEKGRQAKRGKYLSINDDGLAEFLSN
ncbi:MAG TPA: 4-hydroxy-tetrahydrodipicolinate reductase [Clostridia bacterium]|nr:4-hydroxy-tetrahydrodipicolinate reductase [Clostridia bacterium]